MVHMTHGNFEIYPNSSFHLKGFLEKIKKDVESGKEIVTKEWFINFIDSLLEDFPFIKDDINDIIVLKIKKSNG